MDKTFTARCSLTCGQTNIVSSTFCFEHSSLSFHMLVFLFEQFLFGSSETFLRSANFWCLSAVKPKLPATSIRSSNQSAPYAEFRWSSSWTTTKLVDLYQVKEIHCARKEAKSRGVESYDRCCVRFNPSIMKYRNLHRLNHQKYAEWKNHHAYEKANRIVGTPLQKATRKDGGRECLAQCDHNLHAWFFTSKFLLWWTTISILRWNVTT